MQILELTLLCTLFTFAMTALGASLVFVVKREGNGNLTQLSLGFSAGIMTAASIWSLLIPAMDHAKAMGMNEMIPTVVGFILGALFLMLIDKITPHQHRNEESSEGPRNHLSRNTLLFTSVSIHNFPEGMAVGISAAAAAAGDNPELFAATMVLALGVGIQNIPEGTAVSLPFFSSGMSRVKSFALGALSGAVEPLAAVIIVLAAGTAFWLLPWALAFAAGAMLYVVTEELIPRAHTEGHSDLGTISVLSGFLLMMVLDICLG